MKGYTQETSGNGLMSFLPDDLDRSDLIEITSIGDTAQRYIDSRTGMIHDSAAYFNEYLKQFGHPA